jgi:outer membrane protein
MNKRIVLFAAFLSGIVLTRAQDNNWTLERCIQYAIDNNISVKQKQLEADVATETVKASQAAFLPNLNGNADAAQSWGRKVDTYTNEVTTERTFTSSMSLSSSVTLFHGFELQNSLKRDQFSLKARLADIDKLKNDISLNVASTFLQIIYFQDLLKISQNQVIISQAQVERTQSLLNAGKATRGNFLEVQAQLEQDKLQVITDENNLVTVTLTMKQLLELKDTVPFAIKVPEIAPIVDERVLSPVDSIFRVAMENLPEFKSSQNEIKSAEMSLEVAKSYYYPQLTLTGGYSTGYSDARKKLNLQTGAYDADYPFRSQLSDNQSKTLALSLSVPIYNRRSIKTGVNKARISVSYAQQNLLLIQNSVYKDIQKAWNDAHAAFRKFIASEKVEEATAEAFTYSEQKFNAGVISTIEYSTAKTKLVKVQTELLQAKYEYIFRLAILDYYMGKPIKI